MRFEKSLSMGRGRKGTCNITLLKVLKKLKPEERREIITRLGDSTIDDLGETLYNFLYCDLIPKRKVKGLRKALRSCKGSLNYVAKKSNNVATRRGKLAKMSGGVLGTVLSTLIPIISGLIINRMKK